MDKIKIVLVDAYPGIIPGLGLAYLSSSLKQEFKDEVEIKILQRKFEKNLLNSILQEKADIVGYISFTPGMNYLLDLIREIYKNSSVIQIIGGPHITSLPEDLPIEVKIGVIGAGEKTICELVKIYQDKKEFFVNDLKKVEGIVFRDNGQLIIRERRIFSEYLDNIPKPDRDILNIKGFFPLTRGYFPLKFYRASPIMTSRGCPFNCIFCQEKVLNNYVAHSPARVLEEIEELIEKYNVNFIEIMDDQFAFDVKRLEEISLGIERKGLNKKVAFFCYIRADQINDKILILLKKMNTKIVFIGFESGSNKILKYLKQESCSVEKNQKAFNLCQKYKIHVYGSFIFGSPQETMEDMEKTYQFIKKNKIALTEIQTLTPLPGTKVWDYAKSRGIVSNKMNWDNLLLRIKDDGWNQPWLCENVSWDQFYSFYIDKIRPITWHYQQIIKNFNILDLFRPAFFIHFLKKPKFYLSMFKHSLLNLFVWK